MRDEGIYLCREVADTEVLGREGGQRPEGGALHSGLTAVCVSPQRRQATLLERLQDRYRPRSVGTAVSGHGHWGQWARTLRSVDTDTGVSGHGHTRVARHGHCF